MVGCNKKKEKICTYVNAKYANYGGNYIINFLQYILGHKANIEVKKEKKLKNKKGKKKTQVEDAGKTDNKKTEKSPEPKIKMDLKDKR